MSKLVGDAMMNIRYLTSTLDISLKTAQIVADASA